MSFASDVQAVTKTADGQAITGRTRIQGVYYTCTANSSSFDLRNGTGNTDTPLISVNSPAAAGAYSILIPDNGVLFDSGVYVDVADGNVESVTVFYVGGGAA